MHTLVLGIDAFEPTTFERLYEQGRMPHLGKYLQTDRYARLAVSDPPQSEVSWTSMATGLNPGSHGMFDFVHRTPETYGLYVSMLPTKKGLTGTTFVPPYNVRTIFDEAVERGYPATSLWWPAMFPSRPQSPIRNIPGLGTPDILGRLGVGTLFTTDPTRLPSEAKSQIAKLEFKGSEYWASLHGPMRKKDNQIEPSSVAVKIDAIDNQQVKVQVAKQQFTLQIGQWSPVLELSFKVSRFFSMRAITRCIVTRVDPEVEAYFLPVQIHPLRSPWHYAAPRGFVKGIWQEHGPFLTIGWPQDTTALEDGCIDDDQFLSLCESIFHTRERILMRQIDQFPEGLLGCVFDSLDRIQHMFWRDRPDVVEAWYVKLDKLVGRVEERLRQQKIARARLVILSDHGFTGFDHKVHLNRWLEEHQFLAKNPEVKPDSLKAIDWTQTKAYAIGLNSIYLNQQGREGQGIVSPAERASIVRQIREGLLRWQGPDGFPVVSQVRTREEALDGPLAEYGPDLLVGYSAGYRASSETGLGGWKANAIEANRDHWGADHCIDASVVPGVLFANHNLANFPNPSYRDIPALTIGMTPDASGAKPPPMPAQQEDEKVIEERLKGLGYL